MIIGSLEYEKLKSAAEEAAAYREALEEELEVAQKRLGLTQAKLYSLEKDVWRDGEPDKISGSEWFIAETGWCSRAVLRRLHDDHSYDYATPEETYFTAERAQIKRWMQFPDSYFLPPDDLVPASTVEAAVLAEREACAYIAYNACLVPPDGGSPTEEEAAVCNVAAKRIRARGNGETQ